MCATPTFFIWSFWNFVGVFCVVWGRVCSLDLIFRLIFFTFYTPPHESWGVLWFYICPLCVSGSACPSVFSFQDDNMSNCQWIFTKHVHWYCRDLVWDYRFTNFFSFERLIYLPHIVAVYCFAFLLLFIAPACSRVRYRRPIFCPSVNIYVEVRHLCQS